MIVSITDQVLMVWPTVIPKYSFTSQNPASLTWLKKSEPAPMARTSRAVSVVDMSAASGATSPAAEIVATVAEPVASRIATAISQASSERGDRPVLGDVQDHLADAGVDQRLLEAAARADDQQDARDRARGTSRRSTESRSLVNPAARPSVNMPTITAASSAISGEPATSKTRWTVVLGIVDDDVDQRLGQHQDDRQQHGGDGRAEPGPLLQLLGGALRDHALGRRDVHPARRVPREQRPGDDHGRYRDEQPRAPA